MLTKIRTIIIFLLLLPAFSVAPSLASTKTPSEILSSYDIKGSSTASSAATVSKSALSLKRTEESDKTQDSELIKRLQRALQALGYYQGCKIDGWFGPYTQLAVMELQRKFGYWVSGVVDQELFDAIEKRASDSAKTAGASSTVSSAGSVSTESGWVTLNNISYSKQQTNYTCGPASLKMALSVYGINITESWAAGAAGTARTGTSHSGLFNAVSKVNSRFGTKLTAGHQSFKSTGWSRLEKYLKTGNPIIIHLKSWYGSWGHFVVLAGINMDKKQVRLADPSGGWRTVSFSEMERRMSLTTYPSIITIKKV